MVKVIKLFWMLIFLPAIMLAEKKKYTIQEIEVAPKIDGLIESSIWESVPYATDFIQTIPSPLAPANFRTEVKMAYTQGAIYILAKLYQPKKDVQKQLTARDNIGFANTDVFGVYFDTYQDLQNGFGFKVSASGVQQEERLFNGGGDGNGDASWDAAWDSRVRIEEDYWVVEMEIPFQALRFSSAEIQEWGIQFYRLNRKQNETTYWNEVNPQLTGFLAQAGILQGIKNIKPPIRLIFFPYVSTGYQHVPADNTTAESQQWLRTGGMDVKYGMNDAFTLDMTLIPDFSQVISDNLIRNVSPFEQQLSENRPFFQEGVDLFTKQGLFYSRRIGARPTGYESVNRLYGDTSQYLINKNPLISTLYNSFKISGRTKSNTGIGIFNAIGAPSRALITDLSTNQDFTVETQGLANYNILVVDRPLRGQSFFNLTNTNVLRNGNKPEGNVFAGQIKWFDREEKNYYDISAAWSARGNEGPGLKLLAEYAKITGKVRINHRVRYLSPQYDQRDLGLQFDFNEVQSYTQFRYFENKPTSPKVQLYNIFVRNSINYNAQPWVFKNWDLGLTYFILRKNFWDISFTLNSRPIQPTDFYQLISFGKRLKTFPTTSINTDGSSDSRKKLFWAWYFGYGMASIAPKPTFFEVNNTVRYRFNDRLEVSLRYELSHDKTNIGYSLYDASLAEPIVAYRNVKEQSGQINVRYNFSPLLNLTARFRHYNAKIVNKSFHTVDELGNWEGNSYSVTANSYNENYNLQNIDIFLNWIYSPGSRMVFAYKQWLNDAYVLNQQLDNTFGTNFSRIVKQPKAYEVTLRFIYFLDYNKLKEIKGLKKK